MQLFFDNIINARDPGGMIGHKGKKVRSGMLLRTAHLHDASDEDIRRLHDEYHLRRIFDFRSVGEAQYLPDREVAGAVYHALPTIDLSEEKIKGTAIPQEAFLDLESHIVNYSFYPEVQKMARDMYPSLIESEFSQLQYTTFLRLIIETPEGGVLWHCFQGKDRTGWGAAFLLFALGVDREAIVEDFDRSNYAYRGLVNRLNEDIIARGGGEAEMDVVQAFMGVSTKNFNATLDLIDREYGGMTGYLQNQLSLSADDLRILRNRYLE